MRPSGTGVPKSCALLVGMQTGAATVENRKVPKTLEVNLPYDPSILRLGVYPKEVETGVQEAILHCHCCTVHIDQDTETT